MILLDTNVLSELMRKDADPNVIRWLDEQPRASVWTTSVTILEIRFGLQVLPKGKRQQLLMQAFEILLKEKIEERVASFDPAAAVEAADLMSRRHKRGRPGDLRDTLIAGIAQASRATLATRNVQHFHDLSVPVVNPWGVSA